jgi:biotin synthase-like enzyme
MNDKILSIEQGPIRPPNEARSLLLRFTRNCPWNHCLFCPVYKNRKFSRRSVEEIKKDIQTVRDIYDEIKETSFNLGFAGEINDHLLRTIFLSPDKSNSYKSIAMWIYHGTEACFIQDGDNLNMKTSDLVEAIRFLMDKFPKLTRITTYSRSRTVIRKTVDELKEIKEAGLDRVHIGLESGYDPLLKFIKKGVTAAQHIDAGKRLLEAGMEVSEYVMPGLGGQEMWKEHATHTAKVLNQINPHFIRLRSLRIPGKIPLLEKVKEGSFTMQTDDMVAEEIRLFIENLNGIESVAVSDHIMNLLEEVEGKLPDDKEKMLNVIKRYQQLPDTDRLIYRIGRRNGYYRSTEDLKGDAGLYEKLNNLIEEIKEKNGEQGIEDFIKEMADRYI